MTVELSLRGYASVPAAATVSLHEYDRPARWRRAIAGLGVWWAGALVAVFIPVAHLLLVPGGLIAGVIVGASRLKTHMVVTEAHGTCPDCGAEQDLDLPTRWRLPQPVTCHHCQRGLTLEARAA